MNNFNRASTLCTQPLHTVRTDLETSEISYVHYRFRLLQSYKSIKDNEELQKRGDYEDTFIYVYNKETGDLNIPISDFQISNYLCLNYYFKLENDNRYEHQILINKASVYMIKTFEEFFWLVDYIRMLIKDRSKDFNIMELIIMDNNSNVAFKLFKFNTESRAIQCKITDFLCNKDQLSNSYLRKFGGLSFLMRSFWEKKGPQLTCDKFKLNKKQFFELKMCDFVPPKIDKGAFYLKLYDECKYNSIQVSPDSIIDQVRAEKPYIIQIYHTTGCLAYNAYNQYHMSRITNRNLYGYDDDEKAIFDYYSKQGYKYNSKRKGAKEIGKLHRLIKSEDNETLLERLSKISNFNISYHDPIYAKLKNAILKNSLAYDGLDFGEKDVYNLILGNLFDFDDPEQNKFLRLNQQNLNFAYGFFSYNHANSSQEDDNNFFMTDSDESSAISNNGHSDNFSDSFDENDEEFYYFAELDVFDDDDDVVVEEDDTGDDDYNFPDESSDNDMNDIELSGINFNSVNRNDFFSQFVIDTEFPTLPKDKFLSAVLVPKGESLILHESMFKEPLFKKLLAELDHVIVSSFMKAVDRVWSEECYNIFMNILRGDLKNRDSFAQSSFLKSFSIKAPIFLFLPTLLKIYLELKKKYRPPASSESILFNGRAKSSDFKEVIEPRMIESVFLTVMRDNYNKLIKKQLNSYFKCKRCSNKLCLKENLLSVEYTGFFGKCILMGPHIYNINFANERITEMITATYVVKDITCGRCGSYLGWAYMNTNSSTYSYKKNLKIFETKSVYFD